MKNSNEQYILFGAGRAGKAILHLIGKDEVYCFCETVARDKTIEGIPCVSLEELKKEIDTDLCRIILCTFNDDYLIQMAGELEVCGFPFQTIRDALHSICSSKKYVLFGRSDTSEYALGFIGRDNILCISDVWGEFKGDEYKGLALISKEELGFLWQFGLLRECVFLITADKARHGGFLCRFLENNRIPYRYFEDIAREEVMKGLPVYESKNQRESFMVQEERNLLCYMDRYSPAGTVNNYFWQDLWAARKIFENQSDVHYDIGSRLDGFITHLLSFGQKVCLIDIRPLNIDIPGLVFLRSDATELTGVEDESIESLSALCSLEHFGLGRYGDEIDPEACFKCFAAIQRKMKPGGMAYISVPVGYEHLEFNAARVFNPTTVVNSFQSMKLLEFSVCKKDKLEENVPLEKYASTDHKKGDYRFGLFHFLKM